jgi:NADH dehydrogenase FAD-containing subunit
MQCYVAAHVQHRTALGTIVGSSQPRTRVRLAALTLRCTRVAPREIDVAIVGGGPGGLASAAAVVSALGDDVRVKVKK